MYINATLTLPSIIRLHMQGETLILSFVHCNQIFWEKMPFSPQDSALFCNMQWPGLSTGTLPPSFTAKIKDKSLPGKPRWICGPGAACGSCSWCQTPRCEKIRSCDCWVLLLRVSTSALMVNFAAPCCPCPAVAAAGTAGRAPS